MAIVLVASGRASSSFLANCLLVPGLACVDAGFSFSLGAVYPLRLKLHPAAHEGVVCVALCILVAAGQLNTAVSRDG